MKSFEQKKCHEYSLGYTVCYFSSSIWFLRCNPCVNLSIKLDTTNVLIDSSRAEGHQIVDWMIRELSAEIGMSAIQRLMNFSSSSWATIQNTFVKANVLFFFVIILKNKTIAVILSSFVSVLHFNQYTWINRGTSYKHWK